jgi:predicted component of type VI protein secretion system
MFQIAKTAWAFIRTSAASIYHTSMFESYHYHYININYVVSSSLIFSSQDTHRPVRFHSLYLSDILRFIYIFLKYPTMRSSGIFLTLLSASMTVSYVVPTRGFNVPTLEDRDHNSTHHHGGDSTKKECKQIEQLTHLTDLAANQTKLDELVAKGMLDTTEVDELKTKALNATTKLQMLSSNTTLTGECAVIAAGRKTVQECKEMHSLKRLADFAGNQTAVDAFVAKKDLNSIEVDNFEKRIQEAETKLKTLSSNATLTDFCKQREQGKGEGNGTGELA